jgi:hypothetical protein
MRPLKRAELASLPTDTSSAAFCTGFNDQCQGPVDIEFHALVKATGGLRCDLDVRWNTAPLVEVAIDDEGAYGFPELISTVAVTPNKAALFPMASSTKGSMALTPTTPALAEERRFADLLHG